MATHSTDTLIVALDFPKADDARRLVDRLGDDVSFYKVGLELLFSGGLELARDLKRDGKRVFLDLKFLDIANTVERAVANASEIGVDFLTYHGLDRKTVAAALKGRGSAPTKLLSVTVLTSLDDGDLKDQGIEHTAADMVLHRAKLVHQAGGDGVIASGQEAARVRAATGSGFLIVTPGIRLPGGEAGDQARITTPADAIRAGADHIVIGRPITAASDPRAAVAAVIANLAAA